VKQKFIDAHMKVAETYAQLSSAKRLQVGAVVVKNDTIIGIGYNGMPSGWDNNCEIAKRAPPHDMCPDPAGEGYTWNDYDEVWEKLETRPQVIHAESNAICKVTKSTNSSEGAEMFVTHAPCIHCAKLIHQSGIRKVFYRDTYRDDGGLKFLEKCGVEIEKV
jgi:dCMP deaminase